MNVKYLRRLPQFVSAEANHAGHEVHHGPRGFAWGQLAEPLGITTLSLLIATACAGFLMPRNRKLLFKWHRRLAVLTLFAALSHALAVLLFH